MIKLLAALSGAVRAHTFKWHSEVVIILLAVEWLMIWFGILMKYLLLSIKIECNRRELL